MKEKNKKICINIEHLNSSTSEFLETNYPVNSKYATTTAINALQEVIKQINPDEETKIEEMSEDVLGEYVEQFSSVW